MQSLTRPSSISALRRVVDNARFPPSRIQYLNTKYPTQAPRSRSFLSSNAAPSPPHDASVKVDAPKDLPPSASHKRKNTRSPAGKTSLRRVAVEAQSREDTEQTGHVTANFENQNRVIAVAVADQFDMDSVARILRSHGFTIDPDATDFDTDQVIHTRGVNNGDIFVFPSGTLVSWALPEDVAFDLATKTLLPAAVRPHANQIEMEDLEYAEDNKRDSSGIKGEVITLGTKDKQGGKLNPQVDTTLAKIAFSSGLARSTKLAVLETLLAKYFASTREIPRLLSRGSRLPLQMNRRFMLQKTGELLELRAQLNHYSELTDSLPDLFWDSKHELRLESHYEQVGRALDVSVRIKALNEKMDYAQEIASILRQTMSEKHSIHLEWIIIILIAVEVGFELRREWKERRERLRKNTEA